MSVIAVVRRNQYYTDGRRLIRIIAVHKDDKVSIENCKSLTVRKIALREITEKWIEVHTE